MIIIAKIRFWKLNGISLFLLMLICGHQISFSQSASKSKSKSIKPKTIKPVMKSEALPHAVFFQLIDSTEKFVINHQTEFKHIDVPKKFYNQFTGYIRDSAVASVSGVKSLVYYNYSLINGKFVNGDIFWNDTKSYIVFNIDGKKYINFFTREGVQQLKTLFKL